MNIYWCKYLPFKKQHQTQPPLAPRIATRVYHQLVAQPPHHGLSVTITGMVMTLAASNMAAAPSMTRGLGVPRSYIRKPETNIEFTPENGWLEDDAFPWQVGPIFRGQVAGSFRE